MGFCGCSLETTTNYAGLVTILNFVVFVIVDIFILICLKSPETVPTYSENPGFLFFVYGFQALKEAHVLVIIIIIRLSLRLLWLITTPLLFIGNRANRRNYLLCWEYVATFTAIFAVATTVYFLLAHYECGFITSLPTWYQNLTSTQPGEEAGREAARFVLFVDLIDGASLFLVLMIVFIVYVHLRGVQIRYKKREMNRLDQWQYQLNPYRIPRATIDGEVAAGGMGVTVPLPPPIVPPVLAIDSSPSALLARSQYYENLAYQPGFTSEKRKY